jgi:hypothetical protein
MANLALTEFNLQIQESIRLLERKEQAMNNLKNKTTTGYDFSSDVPNFVLKNM